MRPTSWLIAFALATVVLVVQAPVLLGGRTWDDTRYHIEVAPPRLAASDAVLHRELPAWWDGTGLGVPLAAEPSHGAAYPPVWLAATPRLLDLLSILHVFWCALGVALWARRMKASELGAVVAGVLVATTGIVASAALRGALPALAHLPWVAFVAMSPRKKTVSLALLIGAIALSGQLSLVIVAIAIALLTGPRSPRAGLAIAAGLAIGAVQWLPAIFVDGAGGSFARMPLSRLIEVLVPGSFGATDPDRAVAQIAGAAAAFPSLYVGAPLLALAAIGSPSRRMMVLAAVIAVLAFVVHGPAWLGAPELYVAVLAIIAAAHVGRGVDTLIGGERRAVLALGGGAVVLAIALGGIAALRARVESAALDRALLHGGLGFVCLAAALVMTWRALAIARSTANGAPRDSSLPERDGRDLSRRVGLRGVDPRTLAIVALVIAPNVGAQGSLTPTRDRAIVDEVPAWVRSAPPGNAPVRVFRPVAMFEGPRLEPESLDAAISTLAGTFASRWGLAAVRSEDPARHPRHDSMFLAAASAGGQWLERFGIVLAILPNSLVGSSGVDVLATRGSWSLVRYPSSPQAALVFEWVWAPDDATAIARLFPPGAGHGLGAGLVVLHGSGAENQDEPSDPQPCMIELWRGGAIDLVCHAPRAAYAVISSTAARGWSVEVDGVDTAWHTADVMRRAVAVPAGVHRIEWRYTPPGLVIGLVIAGLALAALVALWLITRRS